MRKALISVVVAICLLPAVALAEDDLVRQMELDIRIEKLTKSVFATAKRKAQAAIEKTSLWREWQAARKAVQPESQECRDALRKLLEYQWDLAKRIGIRLKRIHKYSDATLRQYTAKTNAACAEHHAWMRSEEYRELFRPYRTLHNEVSALRKKFGKVVFEEEIRKKLADLKIEISQEIWRKIERSYRLLERKDA